MTRYLVTGGTGYLGRHLVGRLLADGHEVRLLARPDSDVGGLDVADVQRGDVTRREDLAAALEGCERVFHLAAETRDGQDPGHYDRVNHRAVTTLLELASERQVERLIHTSHYFAIGRSGEPRSVKDFVNDEWWVHDPGDMHDAHELSKSDAENSLNQRVALSEPRLALVPTMLYGPEARPVSGVGELSHGARIVRMLADHAAGRYPGLPADGTQLWNLAHVEDVAAAHVAAMEAEDPEGSGSWPPPRWNWRYILGGENVRAAELFQRFGDLAGVTPPKLVKARKGLLGKLFGGDDGGRSPERFAMDSHSWAYTCELATADFGYSYRPLAEGLEQTVAWMRSSGLLG